MAKLGGFNDKPAKTGCVEQPEGHTCDVCGRDFHELAEQEFTVGWQRRAICKRTDGRGKWKEYTAGEIFNWKEEDKKPDWTSITWKRSGLTLVKWRQECNECFFDPNRVTPSQKQLLAEAMAKQGVTAKDTRKAYRLIQDMICLNATNVHMRTDVINATEADMRYAAKYVLWHWPQASNEEMPADIKALCESLTHGPA